MCWPASRQGEERSALGLLCLLCPPRRVAPAQAKQTLLPHSPAVTLLPRAGMATTGENSNGYRSNLVPGQSLGGAVVAAVGP